MKLCVVVLLAIIGLACADKYSSNGRPGCKTEVEMQVLAYRNLWDPTAYWLCEYSGQPARSVRCPDGEAFVDSIKACVGWDAWEWQDFVLPPSEP